MLETTCISLSPSAAPGACVRCLAAGCRPVLKLGHVVFGFSNLSGNLFFPGEHNKVEEILACVVSALMPDSRGTQKPSDVWVLLPACDRRSLMDIPPSSLGSEGGNQRLTWDVCHRGAETNRPVYGRPERVDRSWWTERVVRVPCFGRPDVLTSRESDVTQRVRPQQRYRYGAG